MFSSSNRAECVAVSVIASKSSPALTIAGLCSSFVDRSSLTGKVGWQSPCDRVNTGPSQMSVLSGTVGFTLSVAITERIWVSVAPSNTRG